MLGGVQRPIQAGGDGICLLLVQQGDSLRAQPSAADGVQHVVQGKRGVATGQGDFLLLGNLQGQTKVLQEMLDHKARLVIAVESLGRQLFHSAGLARAAADHLAGLLKVKAALLGKRHGIRHAHHGRGERHLVSKLGSLTLAGTAKAEDVGREALENLADRLDIPLGSAHDQGQRTGNGAGLAASNRAIKRMAAGNLGSLGNVAGKLRGAGGEVDQVRAGLRGGQQAVTRQIDLLNLLRVAHHSEDNVGILDRGLGALRPRGTALDKARGLGLGAGEDAHGIARVQNMAGNGRAHDAGSNKSNRKVLVCHTGSYLNTTYR